MPGQRKIFESLERRPDFNNGEMRLASEAALAVLRGRKIPSFVEQRMNLVLETLAGVN